MAHLTRDGVRIYYEHYGQGPAVLLTHGYGATSQMWAGQIEAFKDRYRIIVWDMRGHGQTDYPEDQAVYSEAHTVADMAAVLDACGEERAAWSSGKIHRAGRSAGRGGRGGMAN